MKLFIVISDSHGNIGSLKKIIAQYPDIPSIIHLGDHYKDAMMLQQLYPEKEYYMVPGNCDFLVSGVPADLCLEVEGLRILLTHGNRYSVKSGLQRLRAKALQERLDVVLFGHTHVPVIDRSEGCLLVNPGSAAYPRYAGPSTYALLEIGNGMAEARIMEVP